MNGTNIRLDLDLSKPTLGETFYFKNDSEPLIDCGRRIDKPGIHVLMDPHGELREIGGYWLRRRGEVWEEVSHG